MGFYAHLSLSVQKKLWLRLEERPRRTGNLSAPFQIWHSSTLTFLMLTCQLNSGHWYLDLVHYSSMILLSVNLLGLRLICGVTSTCLLLSPTQVKAGLKHRWHLSTGGPKAAGLFLWQHTVCIQRLWLWRVLKQRFLKTPYSVKAMKTAWHRRTISDASAVQITEFMDGHF